MSCRIRPFRAEDAEELVRVTGAAIALIGGRAYTSEQTAAWAGRHLSPDRFRERVRSGHAILVVADVADIPVAYTLIEPGGHLDQLYCHPDHTRRGLADRLLDEAETLARLWNEERLFTEASELARPAFERAGYRMIGRRDFTIAHGKKAVPIHNYAMEKPLR
ncbi:GNAT family N-acetyltransferase [Qipengyuania sp. MTN3-11]|uniref:GNAT family N-acetyltransferase n=1 Tax=Qipengyuania sp. MTN3-11 TaxID=3056557 RepID=UPI0036F382E8